MSEFKKYWVVIHYETEIESENEQDAYMNICLGNTIVENATIMAQELNLDSELKNSISQLRLETRKQAAISIILHQVYYKTQDFSLIQNGFSKEIQEKIDRLSLEELETLSIEILTMKTIDDLLNYLRVC